VGAFSLSWHDSLGDILEKKLHDTTSNAHASTGHLLESESVLGLARIIREQAALIASATDEGDMKDALGRIEAAVASMRSIL
jgi:hypothetical protein